MSASIVLTGLSANDPVPGTYVQVNFAQGPSTGSGSPREILLMGNKTTAGAATADTVIYGPDTQVPLQTEADAIALFGAGSELHRMFRRVAKVNKDTTVRAIAVTESGGTAASGVITIATTATGNGNIRVWVGDEFVDTAIASGDTATVIGDAVAVNINAMTHWPVTAADVTGAVTLTAKNKGPRGNWIRFQAAITSGIATTQSASTDAFLTSGATADSNTAALATILAKRYYYIVSAAEDSTQAGALITQVNTQAAPTTGIRQRAFIGSVDTLANITTIATGKNAALAEFTWHKNAPWTPAEIAANQAAIVALFENSGSSPRCNFAGFGNDPDTAAYWVVPASRDATAAPTRANIKSALNNGISPIGVNANGTTYLVNRITSRSLSGSTVDYRIRDSHKVTISDFFADDLQAKVTLQHSGKKLASDPPKGARPPGPTVVTETILRGTIFSMIDQYDFADLLQNVQAIKDGTVVQRETNPSSRASMRIPLQPIDIALQFAIAIDQVA